jgi:hypothetical protein
MFAISKVSFVWACLRWMPFLKEMAASVRQSRPPFTSAAEMTNPP